MERRDFIIRTCTACIAATGLSQFFTSCTSTKITSGTLNKDGILVNLDDFRIDRTAGAGYRSFLVVRNEALQYPIGVYRFTEKEYTALWMQCTHQGTELQAFGDYLQCPAHGSEFDNKGKIVNGPADRDLRIFPVVIQQQHLFIDLRKI